MGKLKFIFNYIPLNIFYYMFGVYQDFVNFNLASGCMSWKKVFFLYFHYTLLSTQQIEAEMMELVIRVHYTSIGLFYNYTQGFN